MNGLKAASALAGSLIGIGSLSPPKIQNGIVIRMSTVKNFQGIFPCEATLL
jgi:hypothetical protein